MVCMVRRYSSVHLYKGQDLFHLRATHGTCTCDDSIFHELHAVRCCRRSDVHCHSRTVSVDEKANLVVADSSYAVLDTNSVSTTARQFSLGCIGGRLSQGSEIYRDRQHRWTRRTSCAEPPFECASAGSGDETKI